MEITHTQLYTDSQVLFYLAYTNIILNTDFSNNCDVILPLMIVLCNVFQGTQLLSL